MCSTRGVDKGSAVYCLIQKVQLIDSSHLHMHNTTNCSMPCLQGSSRRGGPEIQTALAAKQQAQQAQDIARLQEQLNASQKALDEQKSAALKLEKVLHVLCLVQNLLQ